jgi:hypothetical protein
METIAEWFKFAGLTSGQGKFPNHLHY